MKIRPLGGEVFHVDGQTHKYDKVHCHFSQCCERTCKCEDGCVQLNEVRRWCEQLRDTREGM
jgi:hypothetical protein